MKVYPPVAGLEGLEPKQGTKAGFTMKDMKVMKG
jgi:hypothetical protein